MEGNVVGILNENTTALLVACISSLVTVIGFIVTYFLNKRNFKEEIAKQQENIRLDRIADLPYKIQMLMQSILDKGNADILSEFKELMSSVFAYGSEDAIKLIANMQELNYAYADNPGRAGNKVMAYYILLLCQIKYDLTGTEINPEFWYRMRLTDYAKLKTSLCETNNEIVKSLKLSPFLAIKN